MMTYPFDCIRDFMFFDTALHPSDVILIPGARQPQLMQRAAELYHQGLAPIILPSGGQSKNSEPTEWEFLRDVGLALGVPSEAILKEDQATNTFENARNSLKVLQQAEIDVKKVLLVCKNYHARRALLTYQFVFPPDTEFYVAPVVDKTGITKDNWFQHEGRINVVMNELEKTGKYFRKAIYQVGAVRK